MFRRN